MSGMAFKMVLRLGNPSLKATFLKKKQGCTAPANTATVFQLRHWSNKPDEYKTVAKARHRGETNRTTNNDLQTHTALGDLDVLEMRPI